MAQLKRLTEDKVKMLRPLFALAELCYSGGDAITLPGTASTDLCLPLVEKYCNPETMAYSFCTGMLMCITCAAFVPIIIGA